jgi:ABC-type glycerol-3-phosphate transport system permease component
MPKGKRDTRAAYRSDYPVIVKLLIMAAMLMTAAVYIYPLFTVVMTSIGANIFGAPPELIPSQPTFDAFAKILFNPAFNVWIINSVIYASGITAGMIVLSTVTGYAFSKMDFKGRVHLFWLTLIMMMIPSIVMYLPLYITLSKLRLLNTYLGVIIPLIGSPFCVFLLKQSFDSIPKDYEEAAFVDGAGRLYVIFRVMLPMVRPTLITLAILQFVWNWNNFAWPLFVATSPTMWNLALGIWNMGWGYTRDFYAIAAGSVILLIVPIVILFVASESIFRGIVTGGLKR